MTLEWVSGLLGFLPVLVFGALLFVMLRQSKRSPDLTRPPDKFDQIAKLADLKDRGALTEDEFQQEKRKLLERRWD